MLPSAVFRYFYLPWATGICLMLFILIQPWGNSGQTEEIEYEFTPIIIPSDAPVRRIRISPHFHGCTDAPDKGECANQRLENYLYGNTKFPASPSNEGTAGLVMVQLRITSKGAMKDISLLRDPGYGRGKDALDIIQKMQKENISWTPATINGHPIEFQIYLKIRYSNFYWGG